MQDPAGICRAYSLRSYTTEQGQRFVRSMMSQHVSLSFSRYLEPLFGAGFLHHALWPFVFSVNDCVVFRGKEEKPKRFGFKEKVRWTRPLNINDLYILLKYQSCEEDEASVVKRFPFFWQNEATKQNGGLFENKLKKAEKTSR